MQSKCSEILAEIQKVIIGKDEIISKVLMAILANGHILMEDVPGVGKTTLALAFNKVLGLDYQRVQFTSDTMPSDLVGFSVYNKQTNSFQYQKGAVMTNLLLADEINRTSSKTQGALLEVMEERQVTVDGTTYPLPVPFCVIATQNPVGSAGTQMLPSSQLDRFMIKLSMGYPDFKSQVDILKDRHTDNPLNHIKAIIDKDQLVELKKQVAQTFIADSVYEYITRLAEMTRSHEMVDFGLSPRGALAVCSMAKAYAFFNGKEYVTPEDVDAIFPSVASHRLELSRKARMSSITGESITKEICQKAEKPSVIDKVEKK